MFAPGDVIQFWSDVAGKRKSHLCVSLNNQYVFINSPKDTNYPGDLVVPCSDIPCLTPTKSGESIISCSLIMTIPDADLKRHQAQKKGSVSASVLGKIAAFIQSTPTLSEEEKERFFDAAGDWL